MLESVAKEIDAREVSGDDAIAKVSIVGVGMRSCGCGDAMFDAAVLQKILISR